MRQDIMNAHTQTKYYFSIPDGLAVRILNRALLTALKECPEWFYDDFKIETAYGCPGLCPWNGGRYNGDEDFDEGWVDEVVGFYQESGIRYRLIFTNLVLRKPDLQNEIGKQVALQCSKRGGCSVMVSTPMMYEFMGRYPGLTRCWSTTTDFGKSPEEQIRKINQLSKSDRVVVPYEFNNTSELERFRYPRNLEVLVNEECIDHCPRRREHWTKVCKAILKDGSGASDPSVFNCWMGETLKASVHHKVDRNMLSKYLDLGISHFKICGRNAVTNSLLAYLKFFVERGKQDEFVAYCEEYEENFVKTISVSDN